MFNTTQSIGLLRCSFISSLPKRFYSKPLNNDELVLKQFYNRNPRSMELLRIARKPRGFCLDTPTINYYYRLNFEKSLRNMTAWVEHNTGNQVVSASTKEWAIRKHLYSEIDKSAAQNLGRILARRCLQAGIYEMHTDLKQIQDSTATVKVFLDAMLEGGITLEEAPQIHQNSTYSFMLKAPTFPWEVIEEEVDALDAQRNAEKKDIKKK